MSISHNIEEILNWTKTSLDGEGEENKEEGEEEKKEEEEEESNRPEWPT